MKKTKIGIILLSFALALVFAFAGNLKGAKAAKPAFECNSSDANVTLEAESCFVNGRSQERNYQNVSVTLTNNSSKAITRVRYYDGRDTQWVPVDRNIAAGESSSFDIPVKLADVLYEIELDYWFADSSDWVSFGGDLTFGYDNVKPVIDLSATGQAGDNYNREVEYTIVATENDDLASGLKEIRYVLAAEEADLSNATKDQFTETIQEFIDSDIAYAGSHGEYTYTFTTNTTGTYRLWVYAEDYAGNVLIKKNASAYRVDGVAPTIQATPNEGAKAVSHTVNVTVADAASGINIVTYAWKMSEQDWSEVVFQELVITDGHGSFMTPTVNATYQYKIVAEDNAGNVATKESGDFVVFSGTSDVMLEYVGDTSKPAKSFSLIARVTAEASPRVKKIIIVWVPNGETRPNHPSQLESYSFVEEYEITEGVDNEHTFTTQEEMDGKYVVTMLVITLNEPLEFLSQHEGRILTLDKTAPTVVFNPNGSATYERELSVIPTVYDANGVQEAIQYAWAEASQVLVKEDLINASTTGSAITFTGETGSYRLWVLAYDVAGNEVVVGSEPFLVDTTVPTVALGTVKEFYTAGEEITITFADEHSGVDQVAYVFILAGEEAPADEAYKLSNDKKVRIDVRASGSYKLYIKVVDTAGNVTQCGFLETFIVDADAPEVTGAESAGYYTEAVDVTVTDANLREVAVNGEAVEATFKLEETGIYHLVAKDVAGNVTRVDFIVNREGKTKINKDEYNVKRQILLPVLKVEDEAKFYIVLPKGNYEKGDVLVMTKEATDTFKLLDQKSSYIVLKENVLEILNRRSDSYVVTDKEFTDAQADEAGVYGWVIVDLMTNDEAKGLGINTTVIDNEAIALTAGIAGCLSLIAVFVIYRSKKTVRL